MEPQERINLLLEQLPPIALEEMAAIRLMKRMDTKFLTNVYSLERLLEKVKGNYFVQEIAGRRVARYTTTYWDDRETHHMFRIHHCGHRPRLKVRVRTYLDSDLVFLEVKKKDNHGKTTKKRMAVPSLEAVMNEHAGEDFLHELTGYTFADIVPTLSNRFRRITLVNREKTERLTIDFDLRFYNHETQSNKMVENIVVIELKRDGRVSSPILPLLRELRIKPSGFSKYCIGEAVTHPALKQNLFKERLTYIRKVAAQWKQECHCVIPDGMAEQVSVKMNNRICIT